MAEEIKETIEFEPTLKTDIIEAQLDRVRDQINNAFSIKSFDPVAELPEFVRGGVDSTLQGVENAGRNLGLATERAMQEFAHMPEVVSGVVKRLETTDQGTHLLAPMGYGYDHASPEKLIDYKGRNVSQLSTEGGEFAADTMGSLIGAAGGAGIGKLLGMGVGALATGGLGLLAGMGVDAILAPGIEKEKMVRQVGDKFVGFSEMGKSRITGETGYEMAEDLVNFTDTYYAKARDLTAEEINTNLDTFAEFGGFKNIKSPQELKETITTIIEDTREISKNLGMFQDEVVKIMAELKNSGLSKVEDSKEFLYDIQNVSLNTGVDTRSLLAAGQQSLELFRGTEYGASNAFQFGVDALAETRRMSKVYGSEYDNMIGRLGGEESAATNLMRNLTSVSNKYAPLQGYNLKSLGKFADNVPDMLSGVADFVGEYGPSGVLAMEGRNMETVGQQSYAEQAQLALGLTINQLDLAGIGGYKKSEDEIIGLYIQQNPGMSRDDARQMLYAGISYNEESFTDKIRADVVNAVGKDHPTFWDQVGGGFSYATQQLASPFVEAGRAVGEAGYWLSDDVFTPIGDAFAGIERFKPDDYFDDMSYYVYENTDVMDKIEEKVQKDDRVAKANEDLKKLNKEAKNLFNADFESMYAVSLFDTDKISEKDRNAIIENLTSTSIDDEIVEEIRNLNTTDETKNDYIDPETELSGKVKEIVYSKTKDKLTENQADLWMSTNNTVRNAIKQDRIFKNREDAIENVIIEEERAQKEILNKRIEDTERIFMGQESVEDKNRSEEVVKSMLKDWGIKDEYIDRVYESISPNLKSDNIENFTTENIQKAMEYGALSMSNEVSIKDMLIGGSAQNDLEEVVKNNLEDKIGSYDDLSKNKDLVGTDTAKSEKMFKGKIEGWLKDWGMTDEAISETITKLDERGFTDEDFRDGKFGKVLEDTVNDVTSTWFGGSNKEEAFNKEAWNDDKPKFDLTKIVGDVKKEDVVKETGVDMEFLKKMASEYGIAEEYVSEYAEILQQKIAETGDVSTKNIIEQMKESDEQLAENRWEDSGISKKQSEGIIFKDHSKAALSRGDAYYNTYRQEYGEEAANEAIVAPGMRDAYADIKDNIDFEGKSESYKNMISRVLAQNLIGMKDDFKSGAINLDDVKKDFSEALVPSLEKLEKQDQLKLRAEALNDRVSQGDYFDKLASVLPESTTADVVQNQVNMLALGSYKTLGGVSYLRTMNFDEYKERAENA